ncbi:conserved Plasmodium protein, unknown function [Plasmodium berghei]|uniref:Uncharacterized protein n=2 Tax=Plasmodium berghei TaxID=5821 RepID=A0A509AF19_PLABA|nr:conserved Plasmodium protein, unknown function [Plasmodium berghei ANKA]CXI01807.1 conserved Plasmodium protein, unknown function [Plasmodium berghei]SCL91879.1 conserved Plasmodium protein, unknown function [Plasmodium berghei]SCM15548.1 conserved Plasmodium protein, unknown function [Plasmodium berghei]SCM17340.1 conserved Plasmodium protein, unknown function [Plasmodium berghei]SCN22562.1 conserved Plasmodium protein, unknown function [Plasmodium berghei]|eukprot:XP_034420146.1 conserved Plasmodium protein, unknown function [Plasmodium berghei ANKA]
MKFLNLNYYNGEIYEKYKINNILYLLVDNHKFQNENIDFHELSTKKNNYSIMALLGSQIKNLNDDIYKDIDTNDIILALSQLKQVEEQILINENQNRNYILELAEQLYYEYTQNGLIINDHTYNLNEKRNFMNTNLELMNEINNGIRNYERKVHDLCQFSDEKLKKDVNTHYDEIDPLNSDKINYFLNDNDMFYSIKQNTYSEGNDGMLNNDLYNNNNTDNFLNVNDNMNTGEAHLNILKDANVDHNNNRHQIDNNEYENFMSLIADNKIKNRNSFTGEPFDNYRNFNKDGLSVNKNSININTSNINNKNCNNNLLHYNKDETNSSTCCNSVGNINEDLSIYNDINKNTGNYNTRKYFSNASHLESDGNYLFKDRAKIDLLKRKTHYDKIEEGFPKAPNQRNTVIGNITNNDNIHRNNFYDVDMNKINSNMPRGYGNMNDKYDENKIFLKKDDINYDNNNNKLKIDINSGLPGYNTNYDLRTNQFNGNKNSNNIFNKNIKNNIANNVLDNLDKAEQEIVNKHLKNSFTHNDYTARRMSSILLNQTATNKEVLNNRKSFDPQNINKFINKNMHDYNSGISLNKYSTGDPKKCFTTDTNNSSSFILSSINKHNNTHDNSFNIVNNFENKRFSDKTKDNFSRNSFMKDVYLNEKNLTYNNLDRRNYSNIIHTPNKLLNTDNMSNFSRNIHKSVESNINTYTNKYSRALDINDLNSNTSRNYMNSSNSIKSENTSVRDNYAKMLERSKSMSSQIYSRVPHTRNYLKANL